jgi:hypothetical protein
MNECVCDDGKGMAECVGCLLISPTVHGMLSVRFVLSLTLKPGCQGSMCFRKQASSTVGSDGRYLGVVGAALSA